MPRHRDRLLFLHIPKTAGTALVDLIGREYGTEHMVRIYGGEFGIDVDELRAWPRRRRRAVRAVVGHMAFGLHEELPGPSTYVTVLRDPLDRIVSHHGYVLGEPTLVDIHEATGERATLVGHVTGSPAAYLVNNGQTRLLGAGVDDSRRAPGERELERALERIDRDIAVTGIQERIAETVCLMAETLGWSSVDLPVLNVTPSRRAVDDLTDDERAVVEEHNQLDRVLYDHARAAFERTVATRTKEDAR